MSLSRRKYVLVGLLFYLSMVTTTICATTTPSHTEEAVKEEEEEVAGEALLPFLEPPEKLDMSSSNFEEDKNKNGDASRSCCVPQVARYSIINKEGKTLHELKPGISNGMISSTPLSEVTIVAHFESCSDLPVQSAIFLLETGTLSDVNHLRGGSTNNGPDFATTTTTTAKCENSLWSSSSFDEEEEQHTTTSTTQTTTSTVDTISSISRRDWLDLPLGIHKIVAQPHIGSSNCCVHSVATSVDGGNHAQLPAVFSIGTGRADQDENGREQMEENQHQMDPSMETSMMKMIQSSSIKMNESLQDVMKLVNKDEHCLAPKITGFSIVDGSSNNILTTLVPGENASPLIGPLQNVQIHVEVYYRAGESEWPVRSILIAMDGENDDSAKSTTFCQQLVGGHSMNRNTVTLKVGRHTIHAKAFASNNCCDGGPGREDFVVANSSTSFVVTGLLGQHGELGSDERYLLSAKASKTVNQVMVQSQDSSLTQDFVADSIAQGFIDPPM